MAPTFSMPWRVCFEEAWAAYCHGSIPVGAAVFDVDGNLLSRARNRTADLQPPGGLEIAGVPLAHAELNALIKLPLGRADRRSWCLYTTVEPCPLCVGAVCMAGLKRVFFASRDPWAGSTNLLQATPYMRWKGVIAHGPQLGFLEETAFVLHFDYHARRGHPRFRDILRVWQRAMPEAVEKAQAIRHTGALETLARDGAQLDDVIAELWSRVA
ncbi:nucleoside deaminase [Candidatus Bipolaricaulota bacterium]|nr:nucleoside deaminase [Candidatus Bipolaricaulota bacterium]